MTFKNNFGLVKKVSILIFCHFIIDMFTGIWPIYKSLAQLDLVKAGFIATIGGILGNMMQVAFGLYSDSGYRKLFILTGLLLVTSACFYPYTNNYPLLMFLVFSTYLGSSSFHPSGTGLIGTLTRYRKGLAISAFISGGTLGFAFSHVIFKEIFLISNGKTLVMIALPCTAFLLALFTNFETKTKFTTGVNIKNDLIKLFNTCRGYIFILYIIEAFVGASIIGLIFILPEVMKTKQYSQYWCYGGAHMLYVIGSALITIPAGHYSDKTSQKRTMFISLIFTLILYYTFISVPKINLFMFIPLITVLGGAMGVCNPVGVALGNRLVVGQGSLISALLMGFAWAGGSFSTVLVGYLSKKLGNPISALYFLGGFIFVAMILTIFLPGGKKVNEHELNNLQKLKM